MSSPMASSSATCLDRSGEGGANREGRDGVSQDKTKNVGEMAREARFSREMAAARGLHGDPA